MLGMLLHLLGLSTNLSNHQMARVITVYLCRTMAVGDQTEAKGPYKKIGRKILYDEQSDDYLIVSIGLSTANSEVLDDKT